MLIIPPLERIIKNNDKNIQEKLSFTLSDKIRPNNNLTIYNIKKIQGKVYDILSKPQSPQKSFSELLDGLKKGNRVSVNGDKGVVLGFKTIGDRKTGVVIGTGGNNSITISSAKSARDNKLNVLKKPLRKKRKEVKKERTWEVIV